MATYAIGDVQGCYRELDHLLENIAFDQNSDRLWFVGDLVNRGPDSLEVLRLVRSFGDRAVCALGNHDLHLLACAHGHRRKPRPRDTFDEVLKAADREELLAWLRGRSFLHHDAELGFTLVHAGLPPEWDLQEASRAAHELESWLRADDYVELLDAMYGDEPDRWVEATDRAARCRFAVNAFTRMRYCYADGRIDVAEKDGGTARNPTLIPWFDHPARASRSLRILFGHWSTLRMERAEAVRKQIYPLDTGCVWGGALTALRLDDLCYYQVPSQTRAPFD
jgi:bis(5'-nucleosyl)-tetraphosphatase (symmetrical)